MPETITSNLGTDLARLGYTLYRKALVRREQEPIVDPRGQPIGWLLDTRTPMLEAEVFTQVGAVLTERLNARGVRQVAGMGLGAHPMVCSVLATPGASHLRGGFVREQRKPYGRRRVVEGPLDPEQPVVLLDDILNSGRSALRAVQSLRREGFEVVGVLTLFNFTWGGGKSRLGEENLWVDALLDLNLRDQNASSDGSDTGNV